MENDNTASALTEAEAQKNDSTATTPETKEITIPVKYNKEIIELDLSAATELAQKGMKYEVIKNDYELLRELARKDSKSDSDYLTGLENSRLDKRKQELCEKCGGDTELAEHILKLENENSAYNSGFGELKEMFPQFDTEAQVPTEVLENAKMKGTLLLDEYLRYRLKNQKRLNETSLQQKKAEDLSLGSQLNRKGAASPETEEFLKGLWK